MNKYRLINVMNLVLIMFIGKSMAIFGVDDLAAAYIGTTLFGTIASLFMTNKGMKEGEKEHKRVERINLGLQAKADLATEKQRGITNKYNQDVFDYRKQEDQKTREHTDKIEKYNHLQSMINNFTGSVAGNRNLLNGLKKVNSGRIR